MDNLQFIHITSFGGFGEQSTLAQETPNWMARDEDEAQSFKKFICPLTDIVVKLYLSIATLNVFGKRSNNDEKNNSGKKKQRTTSVGSSEYQIRILRDRSMQYSTLLQKLYEELEWKGSDQTHHSLRCTRKNRLVQTDSIQQLDIRALRIDYLQNLKHFRETNQ